MKGLGGGASLHLQLWRVGKGMWRGRWDGESTYQETPTNEGA